MEDVMFKMVLLLVSLICSLVTRYVIPWLKAKTYSEKLNQYIVWTKQVVQSAEKIFCEEKSGAQKKEYCVEFLTDLINKDTIRITEDQLNALIESAVKELNFNENKDRTCK